MEPIREFDVGRRLFLFRHKMRYVLAEFLGTTILILMGNAAVAQNYLAAGTPLEGTFLNVVIAWGLALFAASVVTLPVAPAHLNPASTIMLLLFRGFPKRRVLPAILAQLLGGVTAALFLLSLYPSLPKIPEARHVFCTYPQPHVSLLVAFWNEVLATAVLHIVVMATSDPRHKIAPLAACSIVASGLIAVGLTMGFQTGYALNPARDLGPRFISYLFGWGGNTFQHRGYAWIPILGPVLGAVVGGAVYTFFMGTGRDDAIEEALDEKLNRVMV